MDRANGPGPATPGSREKFEDEKRRIIESCFSKREPDGSLQETYITHLRIVEYSTHPASPPPPQARTPESQKPRVIIIAVRKSGRVRMHKSKENINGTFSIGKTWNLDDLSHIESFTSPQANPNHREWAGDTGFLVTLGKPYFWHAQSDKEKKFFIASMIKIYGKYTGGKAPELLGFDQRELEQVMGAGKRPINNHHGPPMRPPPPHQQIPPMRPGQHGTPPPIPNAYEGPPRTTKTPPIRHPPSGANSPAGSFESPASRERDRMDLRKAAQNNKSQESMGTPPIPSRGDEPIPVPPRSRNGPPGLGPPPGPLGRPRDGSEPPSQQKLHHPPNNPPPQFMRPPSRPREDHTSPQFRPPSRAREEPPLQNVPPPPMRPPSRTRDEQPSPQFRPPSRAREDQPPPPHAGAPPFMRPPSRARDEQPPSIPRPPSRARDEQHIPPERRRPPMDPTRPQDRDLVPAPLIPGTGPPRKEPVMPPPRSAERSFRKNSIGQGQRPSPVPLPISFPERPAVSPIAAPESHSPIPVKTPELPEEEPPIILPALALSKPTSPIVATKEQLPSPVVDTPPTPQPAEETKLAVGEKEPDVESKDKAAEDEKPAEATDGKDETSRPGLGPMIRPKMSKGDVAGAFRKAASAASAFKPRPGGAGDRLRQAALKVTEGPDGITGVVPAPPKPEPKPEPKPDVEEDRAPAPEVPARAPQRRSNVPEVKLSVPASRPSSVQADAPSTIKEGLVSEAPKDQVRRSPATRNDATYLQSLGIDYHILDDRSEEFGRWLDYFGWVPGPQMQSRHMDEMKIDLDRELNKAQAGGWLARFQEEDDRVDAIKLGIDVSILECEELDNLLTLYSVELSTLSEDIAYIEAQGQGLQVQTANQKLLKKELESLLETCAITSQDLEVLRIAPLDNMQGLEDVESSLVTLFKAMIKIDPKLGGRQPEKTGDASTDPDQALGLNSDYENMRIVQEKKEMYMQESSYFMQHLANFMPGQFDLAFSETRRAQGGALAKKGDSNHHEAGRDILWKYSPLMLYARDADLTTWASMLKVYENKCNPIYKAEFQIVITNWRRNARKMTGEEAELLFSSQIEKQQENVATAARKLTVKRSQTLARALRSPLSDGSKAERQKAGADNRSFPYEVFAGVLDELLPLVEMEQNFIIDFFHATTLEQVDFPDAVAANKPGDRRGGNLRRHRLMEPDRDLARRVTRAMDTIFSFLDQELIKLMEWVIGQDPLQGVGMFVTIEKKMADISQTNQEFVNTIFQKQHGLLGGRFRRFVDEQIRAIEETKVKIHKRKGVIHFIRVFPSFSTAVENMLAGIDPNLPIRRTVDREYERILKSMFESLQVIARENPAAGLASGGADPEDKEALNFHILLIENMNHFAEEIDTRSLDILEFFKNRANNEYNEHMNLYLGAVMRRPLGKLLDHLENIEAQLQTGKAAALIAAQPSNSKVIFNKVLGNYDSKEVRKGIEALRKRIEKHFGDADDPALSRDLVAKVLRESEKYYNDIETRIGRIITDVYEGDVAFEWPRADVKAAFR